MAKNQPANPTNVSETSQATPADEVFLTEGDLARRWIMSVKTLQANRLKGVGVRWVKFSHNVRYRMSDVLAYEQAHLRHSTSSDASQRHSSREA